MNSGLRRSRLSNSGPTNKTGRAVPGIIGHVVSIRRSPRPFQASIFFWVFTVIAWLVAAIIGLGGAFSNGAMALFGTAILLIGLSLLLNLNGCADYMRDAIRKDAPYGYDYWRYAFAEGPGGMRLPGFSLAVMGVAIVGYAILALAS